MGATSAIFCGARATVVPNQYPCFVVSRGLGAGAAIYWRLVRPDWPEDPDLGRNGGPGGGNRVISGPGRVRNLVACGSSTWARHGNGLSHVACRHWGRGPSIVAGLRIGGLPVVAG